MYILRNRITRTRVVYDTYLTGTMHMLGMTAPVTSFDRDKAKVFDDKGAADAFAKKNLNKNWKPIKK